MSSGFTPEQAEMQAAIDSMCMSMFDGCACMGDRGHEGLHWCDAEHVPDSGPVEWTTEQGEEWIAKIGTGGGA